MVAQRGSLANDSEVRDASGRVEVPVRDAKRIRPRRTVRAQWSCAESLNWIDRDYRSNERNSFPFQWHGQRISGWDRVLR